MSAAPRAYPAGPVTFVSAAPPGGGWHQICVKTADALRAEGLVPAGIEVVVTPGGLAVFEQTIAARRGDDRTLIAFSPGLTMQILMKGSRHSYADITPIAALSTDYGALVAHPGSPISTLPALIDTLRRRPAEVPIAGGSGPGAMHHGMVSVVAAAAGVPAAAVPYLGQGGVAEALRSVRTGQAPVAALGAADVLGEVREGRLRVLAVLAERRLPELPDAPNAREQGLDVVFPMWRGFYGPPAMPARAVAFWSETFTRLCRTPTWGRVLRESNWFPLLLVGEAFRAFLQEDTRRYAGALLRAGIGREATT